MKQMKFALVLGGFLMTLAARTATATSPLPKLYELPTFELRDQNGSVSNKAKWTGKVSIVDFIFTSCGDECPLMTNKMKSLQDKLKGNLSVQFVSVTTDPKVDSPKVLKAYAKVHKVNESNWLFLTGSKKVIVQLASTGFKFPASEKSVNHSQKFSLVDAEGWVRGYYDSSSSEDLARLVADASGLIVPSNGK